MTVIASHNTQHDLPEESDAALGTIASWQNLAIAIRIGCFDLLAAGRVVSDRKVGERVHRLADEVSDAADSLEKFVADTWGYRPRVERGPASTCETIMKRLQARFGDRAVLLEAENYHQTILGQLDRLSKAVDGRIRWQLVRQRDTLVAVLAVLHSLSADSEYPARAAAS